MFRLVWIDMGNAYEGNINITVGLCHECYSVYPYASQYARGMQETECMYSITPEMVMEEVEKCITNTLWT